VLASVGIVTTAHVTGQQVTAALQVPPPTPPPAPPPASAPAPGPGPTELPI
jgi:hypothetical protein